MSGTPKTKPVPIDSPGRRRLPPLLRRAWYSLNQAFRRRITHTGATPDQFTALRSLIESDAKGITQRELARLMSSDPNTIASLLERMEKAGWVKRHKHERDRRAYRIRITAEGRKLHGQLRDIAIELQSQVLDVLPESEREPFLMKLTLVAEACRDVAVKLPRRNE